ncbi:F0F1 ATP synthase subunit gamma, partial [Mycoplasmopsis alligatoris]
MASLNILKGRINVVTNTKKITHAMELVASSKLRKARELYENIKSYQDNLEKTFNDLLLHVNPNEFNTLFPKHPGIEANMYILITSDLGLCGSYNSNLITYLKQKIQPKDMVVVVGSKGYAALSNSIYKDQIIKVYHDYGDTVSYNLGNEISKLAIDTYYDKKINGVNIIYTKFISNVQQDAVEFKLFPFQLPSGDYIKSSVVEFEPDANTILKNSVPLYVGSMIYCLGTSAKISEMASRRTAM